MSRYRQPVFLTNNIDTWLLEISKKRKSAEVRLMQKLIRMVDNNEKCQAQQSMKTDRKLKAVES